MRWKSRQELRSAITDKLDVNMLFALRSACGILVFIAVTWQLTIHLDLGYNAVNFFSYFTNLSNLFAAIVLLSSAVRSRIDPDASCDLLRAASVVNMSVVGIVFAVLLRNEDLGSLLPWINVLLHYVMPCVVVAEWMLQPPRQPLLVKHLLLLQLFPLLYLLYVMIRGSIVGWYPYPFLNPATVGGYAGVVPYALGIAATYMIVGWALLKLGNRLRGSVRQRSAA